MYFFILGALVTQFTYIAIQWWQLRYKEYLYYCAYIGTFILYMIVLFRGPILHLAENSSWDIALDNFKRPLAFLLYYEYFVFGQYFIGLKTRFPEIYNRLRPLGKVIFGFIACQVILQAAGIQYTAIGDICYYSFSIFLFLVFIIFIIKLWKSEDRLVRYVLWASLSVSVGAFISNLLIILWMTHVLPEALITYYFIPSCLGAAFEIYFFNTGITYKVSMAEKKLIIRQQELIKQLSENEEQLIAQQRIRNKLAQDLHDDIGATMSGIALHSHMARRYIAQNKTESVVNSLNLIADGAVEMVNNLNDVVWAVNPKYDNVEEMLERLKEYTLGITQAKNIRLNWEVEPGIKDMKLPVEYRRNVYLICKEAVNNAVKYAECGEIVIGGKQTNQQLIFSIRDDGKGFDLDHNLTGNGLKNMQERAKESDIQLSIQSHNGKGTYIGMQYEIRQ
ncbi:MAG: 7TM diverse intracellular signaling domain-containing protein [Bacteroidota bacterium]|nr:7TM diverse intracellular signaling domain-containing protein [Bacteroidota bacterium]